MLHDLRKVADEYNAVLIGETWTENIDELKQYYGEHNNELQMPMDFMFTTRRQACRRPSSASRSRPSTASGGWPAYVISNHDIVRSYNRYGDGKHNDDIAKLMAGLYLTLRGTPIMYYGEEIGMENNDPKRKEDVKDPDRPHRLAQRKRPRRRAHSHAVERHCQRRFHHGMIPGCRFRRATRPTTSPPNRKIRTRCWSSIRKCLALRHTNPALLDGNYIALNEDDPNVLSYLRTYKGKSVLVALNMTTSPQKANHSNCLRHRKESEEPGGNAPRRAARN